MYPQTPAQTPEQAGFDQGAMGVALSSLPDNERQAVEAELAKQKEAQQLQASDKQATLDAIATMLKTKRGEFVTGRQVLGIEDEWIEDQDHYDGVDDANRNEEGRQRTRKPTQGGGSSGQTNKKTRSNIFLNITAPYVDAAAARVGDMLLPTDDRSWGLQPTPLPNIPGQAATPMAQAVSSAVAAMPAGAPQPGQPPMQPGQAPAQGGEPGQTAQQSPEAAQADAVKQTARRRADNAQDKIDDWLTQCNVHRELRKVIRDAARIGTGVLKGPYAVRRRSKKREGNKTTIVESVDPASRAIPVWNVYPDPTCGPDIQNGTGIFEVDILSGKRLADLRGQDDYFDDQIEQVLQEKPLAHIGRINTPNIPPDAAVEKQQYETWIFHGHLTRDELEQIQVVQRDTPESDLPPGERKGKAIYLPVIVQMVNDRCIKVALNPLDAGEYPYDFLPWSEREGMVYGKGVSRKIRVPQRMVNGAVRNMMDNAAISAGLILLLRKNGLTSSDGNYDFDGGTKLLYFDDTKSVSKDAKQIMQTVEIPSRQQELLGIVNFALKIAEDVTGMPLLLQGQQGKTPDVLGITEILQNNANGVLRDHAKNFDDFITEPHIQRYYQWLMEYSDNPEEQGDFQIDARGSSALVERELQNKWIAQMGAMVKDPAFKIDPAKWFAEFSKSVRFDPKRIQYTDEEWKTIQAQPPPKDIKQIVAEIMSAAALERTKVQSEADQRVALLGVVSKEGVTASQLKAALIDIITTDQRERDILVAKHVHEHNMGAMNAAADAAAANSAVDSPGMPG